MNVRTHVFQVSAFALAASLLLAGCGRSATFPPGDPSPTVVEIRPQIGGHVDRIGFAEGARVTKGQILFRIDPVPFRDETERRFIARNHAISTLDQARANLARAGRLPAGSADVGQLSAAIEAAKADLTAATAALNASKIDLEYTQIRAPIAGLVSRALIKQGEFVSNESLLTTIVSDAADRGYPHATARATPNVSP